MESIVCQLKNKGNQNEFKSEVNYSNYLKLEKLLSAQDLRSIQYNKPAHHEHLFIITHQVYELWFKQIIFELDSVRDLLRIKETAHNHYEIIKRLQRLVLIMKLLIDQFAILETMTPSDFLEFRQFLCSASGFQSLQFRLIENKLGLLKENRSSFQKDYMKPFCSNAKASKLLIDSETSNTSLFHLLQQYLENFPWSYINYERFCDSYKAGVQNFLTQQNQSLKTNEGTKIMQKINSLKKKRMLFQSLFDADEHKLLVEQKERRFSQKAILGAIAVSVYQYAPELNTLYQILNLIADVDLHLIKWRNYHLLVVQKMIGSQNNGTGGSSGYSYLQSTLSNAYKIFIDLENVAMFLISPDFIPSFAELKVKNDKITSLINKLCYVDLTSMFYIENPFNRYLCNNT